MGTFMRRECESCALILEARVMWTLRWGSPELYVDVAEGRMWPISGPGTRDGV